MNRAGHAMEAELDRVTGFLAERRIADLERLAAPVRAVGEQLVIGEQGLEHVHLEFEPVGFLGIDGEVDVGL